ncbi:SAV_2336 N-terminal domain-related protein [Streptomyces morookaense]|uniref:SAV_2336 N-terminal domain-related protein n=1 Tax=Streptomyces morookaense TaxID=1970 RepID=UPI0033FAEB7C
MTAPPPEQPLGQLVARLRAASWELTAEELADAVWLARWTGPYPAEQGHGAESEPEPPRPAFADGGVHSAVEAPETRPPGRDDGAPPAERSGASRLAERTGPVQLYARGGRTGGGVDAFPIRIPMAASLPGLLGLQRALRPLRGYRPAAARARGPLDEDATAERGACTGVLYPVFRRGGRRAASMQLLMDASPSMVVWERMLEELRQTCAQLGVFRDVQVRYLHRADDGTPLVGTSASPAAARRQRPRPADQFRDPTGQRLTLVISDCVGPLWQEGRAQRLLHHWSRSSPLAVVQPLPPRMWPRTALPAGGGTLVRDPGPGGRLGFEPEGYGPLPAPGALPVPVLLPTREALGSWARLLSGPGRTTVHGAAGWLLPDHPARPVPPGCTGRDADQLLRTFRAGASPGALRLAVHLAAVPLTLPVMQVVQRAMLPDTGPMELAEVLLGGLLQRVPDPRADGFPGVDAASYWYEFADGVREMLLRNLDRGAAALVLKHCSDYVERHFGKGARNFAALAAAQLAGDEPVAPGPERLLSGAAEPELFAEIPARVVRWYRPVPVGSGPVGEAERLLRLWRVQADPTLLHRARTLAGPAAGSPLAAEGDADGIRARIVLGEVLLALAGTEAVRGDAQACRSVLEEAVDLLDEVHAHTPAGSPRHTEAALELAAAHHACWKQHGGDHHLLTAARILRALSGGRPARHLRLGRVLLDLGAAHAAEAAAELRIACDLLDTTEAPPAQRCAALLDLAGALRLAQAPATESLAVLARAAASATDDLQRLACLAEQARAHDSAGAPAESDEAYAAAVALTDRHSVQRCELLMEWGESLLRRAAAEAPRPSRGPDLSTPPHGTPVVPVPSQASVDPDRSAVAAAAEGADDAAARAEAVLREAFAMSPGRSPLLSRTQLLLGRALVLRFRRQGFLPDLYESSHLLEQAARRAPDGPTRAEAWLELGEARLALAERGAAPQADAAAAFASAVEEARTAEAYLVTARAAHRYGTVLEGMGLHRSALAAYRDAQRAWHELTDRLAEVPWDEVEVNRNSIRRLERVSG